MVTLPKIIVQFQNLAASSVQKLILFFCFLFYDVLSKDQEIFISQKNEKKARGIIFRGVKTNQCMTHVSTKNKMKHEN